MGRIARLRKKIVCISIAALLLLPQLVSERSVAASQTDRRSYSRIVVLGDPHFGGEASKLRTISKINSWDDVDLIVIMGDIVAETGSAQEYILAKEFVASVEPPVAVIAGNHEFMYADTTTAEGKLRRAGQELRRLKLKRFKQAFDLDELYYTKRIGRYLLIFLSPDVTDGKYLTEISASQLEWLRTTLTENSVFPTVIFFHAPLKGTLEAHRLNPEQLYAQPFDKIHDILAVNPQIVLWISGHSHTAATTPGFNSGINVYDGRIVNIHNPSMTGKTIWTNSLYLFDDKIVVKTYNHTDGNWVARLERVVYSTEPR